MMARPHVLLLCAAIAPVWVLLVAPVPAAFADPCPDVEVVFARGTTEPPGVGFFGENFVDSLRSRVGAKSVGVHPVDYPATANFPTAADGIAYAGKHIENMAASCPKTRMVLGRQPLDRSGESIGVSRQVAVRAPAGSSPRRRWRPLDETTSDLSHPRTQGRSNSPVGGHVSGSSRGVVGCAPVQVRAIPG
jgi:hypothetical protein